MRPSGRMSVQSHPFLASSLATVEFESPIRWRQQAVPGRDSPGSIITESTTATTPESPRTPNSGSWSFQARSSHPTSNHECGTPLAGTRTTCRCGRHRDHLISPGDLAPMSQREPGLQYVAGRSPEPSGSDESRLSVLGPGETRLQGHADPRCPSPDGSSAHLARRSSERLPGSWSFQGFLNPVEERPGPYESAGFGPSLPRSAEGGVSGHALAPAGHGTTASPFTGAQPEHPGTTARAPTSLSLLSPSERSTPAASYPLPALSSPRRMFSPPLPRVSNFRQGLPPPGPSVPASPRHLGVSPSKRSFEPETVEERGARAGGPSDPSRFVHAPALGAFRPFSQPAAGQLDRERSTGAAGQDRAARPPSAPLQHPTRTSASTTRTFSAASLSSTPGVLIWKAEPTEVPGVSGLALGGGEGAGQHAFMTLPGTHEPIQVEVDYQQGSRKADEKRRNNAKASGRHRRKKKTLEEERKRELEELKEHNQHLLLALQEISKQADFYRDERDRLRELVARTPSISDHANGPPTPTPRSSATSLAMADANFSSYVTQPSSEHQANEALPAERPAQRQRTDNLHEQAPRYPSLGGNYPMTVATCTQEEVRGVPVPTRPPHPMRFGVDGSVMPASGESLPSLRRPLPPLSQVESVPQDNERDSRPGSWAC